MAFAFQVLVYHDYMTIGCSTQNPLGISVQKGTALSMAENRWATGVTRVMGPLKVELFWPLLQTVLFWPTLISGDVQTNILPVGIDYNLHGIQWGRVVCQGQGYYVSFAVAVVQRHTPDPQRGAKVDGHLDSLASLLYQLELLEG